LGIKASDEFAVPLYATHHHQLHNTTKEREWWQERKIDPLMVANTLWGETQRRSLDSRQATDKEPIPLVASGVIDRIEHAVTVREISTATDQTVSFFHALAPPLVAIAYMANSDCLFLDA
jgi:hypothetical protein